MEQLHRAPEGDGRHDAAAIEIIDELEAVVEWRASRVWKKLRLWEQ